MSEKSDKPIRAIYNPIPLKTSAHAYIEVARGYSSPAPPIEKLLGVDKRVDTFVPLRPSKARKHVG